MSNMLLLRAVETGERALAAAASFPRVAKVTCKPSFTHITGS